ncbi:MAG TPA: acyl-CoA dehydrogenase family protein, partial [Vicinamibacterales bacterium]|nr:acyl-CoA dehydrogenase family protein [Vicinamibacterales bacterium]
GYSALLVGLMREALRLTLHHLKERRQFGVPIGSFQAIRHRCASMYVGVAATRALLFEACEAAGSARQALAAAAAKAKAAEVALKLVEECVQFHGATGFSDAHDIGLFFRRAMALVRAGGDAPTCRRFFGRDAAQGARPAGASKAAAIGGDAKIA